MAEGDRLCHLQVREARHRRGRFTFGQIKQVELKLFEQHHDVVNRIAQIEADIRRHLIVARTPGMQSLASIADEHGQALFDVQVHILKVERPCKAAGLDLGDNLRHAALYFGKILCRNDFLPAEHACVRKRAVNVLAPHAFVEIDRGGVALDQIGHRLGKTTGPGILRGGDRRRRLLCVHDIGKLVG